MKNADRLLQNLRPFVRVVVVEELVPVVAEALRELLVELREGGRLGVEIREGRLDILARPVFGGVLQWEEIGQR